MFKAAVVCVVLIRAFGTYTCEFVRVTGICSTNTRHVREDRPTGRAIQWPLQQHVRGCVQRMASARVIRRYGALVTTAQLPNCITAAGESRGNFDRSGLFPARVSPRFCRSVGHKRIPCFRFSRALASRDSGFDRNRSWFQHDAISDWITWPKNARIDVISYELLIVFGNIDARY